MSDLSGLHRPGACHVSGPPGQMEDTTRLTSGTGEMSYQVLARKWRPRQFSEMVGQEHVLRALTNALDEQRLHHAYLFSGTRGVGKTTIARIFAKSLNCEEGVSAHPCGECDACREIDEGRFVDLIEVDAASRTKVEDTRELMDNVQYAPTRGRYKVYLIDEVHMLSQHSFNALLKTLEEPPPHVKFLLATTEPRKLPVTILSRCLQFNLKPMPEAMIQKHLGSILERESIAFEPEGLQLLAKGAAGSMRDALSLLDQAIAFGGGNLNRDGVAGMLGVVGSEVLIDLLTAVVERDAQSLFAGVEKLADQVPDFAGVLADLLSLIHRVAVQQVLPDDGDGAPDAEAVADLARRIPPADVQAYYQVALKGRRDLDYHPDPRHGFEMILLRMLAFRPAGGGEAASPAPAAPQASTRPLASSSPAPSRPPRASSPEPAKPAPAPSTNPEPPSASPGGAATGAAEDWNQIFPQLGLRAMALQVASHCALKSKEGSAITLTLPASHTRMCTASIEKQIAEALGRYFGEKIQLKIVGGEVTEETPAKRAERHSRERQSEARESIDNDPLVADMRDTFGAEVIPESVRPVDPDAGQ